MIEAFEAGAPLTAHGRETDAQATIASTRTASAALEGVAIEVAPESRPEQVVPHEDWGSAATANLPGVTEEGDLLSLILPLMAAMQAQHRQDMEAPMLALHATTGALADLADARTSTSPADARIGMPSDGGAIAITMALAGSPVAARSEPVEGGRIGHPADTFNSWISQIVARDAAGLHLMSGVRDVDAPATLPGAHQDAQARDPEGASGTALTSLLAGGGQAGSAAPGVLGDFSPERIAIQQLTGISASNPSFGMAADDGGPVPTIVRAVQSQSRSEGVGSWAMLPFGPTAPESLASRWMSPPPPGGEPVRAEGRPSMAASEAVANNSSGREDRGPVMVHATFHLDGSVLAHAVSEHIVGAMNGPLGGTGGFDPRRSYTPVEG